MKCKHGSLVINIFFYQEYGRHLGALGVVAADLPAYISLWQCVAPQDRQEVVRF